MKYTLKHEMKYLELLKVLHNASWLPFQDYMALQIENGQVVFKYDLNSGVPSGTVAINHPHYVADGQWYKVTAKRSDVIFRIL